MASKSKQLISCMSKAKGDAKKIAACKSSFGKNLKPVNIFDPISKEQRSRQDSAMVRPRDKDNIFYRVPRKKKKP
jgi:hypothetical protein